MVVGEDAAAQMTAATIVGAVSLLNLEGQQAVRHHGHQDQWHGQP